jgi:hypothetical protein
MVVIPGGLHYKTLDSQRQIALHCRNAIWRILVTVQRAFAKYGFRTRRRNPRLALASTTFRGRYAGYHDLCNRLLTRTPLEAGCNLPLL